MIKRATNVWLIVGLAAWAAMVALFWLGTAHGQSASQPVVPINDPGNLLQVLLSAWHTHNWPVLITSVCVIGLIIERHFKGLTGNKFSQWLGTKWGMFLSSSFTAVVTAASTVAFKGWKEIGNACVAAVMVAFFNFFAQLAGPATKTETPAALVTPAPAGDAPQPDADKK
jgi:hypothetical protein